MNRKMWNLMGVVGLCFSVLFLFGQLSAEEGKAVEGKAAFTYTGAAKCKTCHSTAKSGGQYKLWEASLHAGAFKTLQTEAANKIAQEKGIKVPAAEAPECLGCHVTAHGAAAEVRGAVTNEEGVGCESCHGPGSEYFKMSVMKQLYAGEIEGATVGLTEANEALCVTCHNEKSPTFKGFKFDEYAAKIAHPIPAAAPATE
ncbi:MAG: cytochrome c family protein [Candidatus Eisenbacteria bacterium]